MSDPSPPDQPGDPSTPRTCTAHTSAGKPCRAPAVRGATVCAVHGGRAPQVKRAAARRLAEQELRSELARQLGDRADRLRDRGLGEALDDAVTRQWAWTEYLGEIVEQLEQHTEHGERKTVAVELYEQAKVDLARLAKLGLDAGVDERQTRVIELHAALVVALLDQFRDEILARAAAAGLPSELVRGVVQSAGDRVLEARAVDTAQ